ncbi:MAG: hypothetical protein HYU57_06605, partial [Micavibrio aeruginosavorus]|nr:hypothetical protein [Micavibrio aeruginosavorus]
IPAGTGAYINQIRKLASQRDQLAMAAQQQVDALTQNEEGLALSESAADMGKAANG